MDFRRVRGLLLIPACVAGIGLVAAPPATATAPTAQVVFQHAADPTNGTVDSTSEAVANALIGQFGQITSAWDVYISLYYVDDDRTTTNDVVDRLLGAIYRSHARLHVVLDQAMAPLAKPAPTQAAGCPATTGAVDVNGAWSAASARLRCIVTTDQASIAGGYAGQFKQCADGCLGSHSDGYGIDHNKYVLFSGPAGQRFVFSSSANWSPHQLRNDYQTLTEVRQSTGLYNAFLGYWQTEYKDAGPKSSASSDPTYGNTHYYTNANEHVSAYFFPRTTTNPQLMALTQVDCSRGGFVRIASNGFDVEGIYSQVVSMRRAGCTVDVVSEFADPVVKGGNAAMAAIGARCMRNLHRKDLIIDGYYSDGTTDHNVLTGSLPFQNGTSTSDNSVIRLQGLQYLPGFKADYDQLWGKATPWTPGGCTPPPQAGVTAGDVEPTDA